MAEENNKPDTRSLAHQRQEEAATICRDAFEGPLHVRKQGKRYLPAFPREDTDAYRDRLETSVFYDATARTVHGLTGLVFAKPPKRAETLPPELEPLWDNLDLRGTHGDVFCADRYRDGEIDGHFVVFVDMQRRDPDRVRTLADEREAGLRPYWIGIRKQDVYGFDTIEVNGRAILSHFRYGELATEADGKYGQKEVRHVREYNLVSGADGRFSVGYIVHALRKNETGHEAWIVEGEGVLMVNESTPMDEIPVAIGYLGERKGWLESKPPHLPLALENVKHYQLVSDNDNCLHIASVPFPVFIGLDADTDLSFGPNRGIKLPPGGTAMYLEPEGNGLEAMERRINKSEQRMAILGLSMLMSESRAAETATSKRIDKAESDSALSGHARASEDAFEEALRLSAKWLGITEKMPKKDPASRWIALNRDFENMHIDAQMVAALKDLVADGRLRQETLWDALQRGNVLPSTFDADKETALLGSEDRAMPEREAEPEIREAA